MNAMSATEVLSRYDITQVVPLRLSTAASILQLWGYIKVIEVEHNQQLL